MAKYTNKKLKLFSVLFGLTVLGVATGIKTASAKEVTQQQDVKFTFNSTISMDVDNKTMTITDMVPGQVKDSSESTITVTTNAYGGYYMTATAGTNSTDTNLNNSGISRKITNIGTSSNFSSMNEAADDTWGFTFTKTADFASSKYNGLPKDGSVGGATGAKLVDISQEVEKVKCKFGVKAGSTLPAGTYQNVVNFYVVANGS